MKNGYMLIGLLLSLILLPSALAYPSYDSKDASVTNETEAFDQIHEYTANFAILPFVTDWIQAYDYVGSNTSYSFNISTSAKFNSNWYNIILLQGYNGSQWINLSEIDCNGTDVINQTINVTDVQPYTNASGYFMMRFTWLCDQIGGDTCDSADGRIYEVFTVPDAVPSPTTPTDTSQALVILIISVITVIIAISILVAIISLTDTSKGLDLSQLVTTTVISFIGTIIISLLLLFM